MIVRDNVNLERPEAQEDGDLPAEQDDLAQDRPDAGPSGPAGSASSSGLGGTASSSGLGGAASSTGLGGAASLFNVAQGESVDSLLLRLGIRDIGGWRFNVGDGDDRLGRIDYICKNLKATCQQHKNCSLYASLHSVSDQRAVWHLVDWLHRARRENLDVHRHQDLAVQLKVEVFGMKVRGV